MNQYKKSGSIQQDIFRTHMILLMIMAVFLSLAGFGLNIKTENERRDENLQNVAQSIAHSEMLRFDKETSIAYLDSLKESLSDIDVISIVDADGNRFYHSNPELIGTTYDGEMPDFSKNVQGIYAENSSGPSGQQRRAYAAIYDKTGVYRGFVIAIMLQKTIRTQTLHILLFFLFTMVMSICVELMVSRYISREIKGNLLGYEPDTFSAMYKIRDSILESIDEGVMAVGKTGEVQFVNQPASKMLKINGDQKKLDSCGKTLLRNTLKTGEKEFHVQENDFYIENVIVDRYPIYEDGKVVGALGILHDRSEYTRLMEDLSGTRYLVDSMRANNHDFTNKLHVILGLIQMGMNEEAIRYIENITLVQRELISFIMKSVEEPSVAALLIGKVARASECDAQFVLREGTSYVRSDYPFPSEALVTIIGNLIDNALDSMNISDTLGEAKELLVGIFSKPGALLITVDDTGCGISGENLERIFENGYSTKGEGRGTGLYETKKIVERFGGVITVESQENVGTSFTVSFKEMEA